ncbi:MAG: hypothetical protein H7Z13_17735 [Ferruginibacter sp.]|nr:hypothetical protein [Ferruginibacter sp.]
MFLNPRIYKIRSGTLPGPEHRTRNFYFEHPFIKTDTTIYQLPEGFGLEPLPGAKQLTIEYVVLTRLVYLMRVKIAFYLLQGWN